MTSKSPAPSAPSGSGVSDSSPAGSPAAGPPVPSSGRYGAIFALSGKAFLPVGFLARLPVAMLTVGALTLVSEVSGSYALGGLAAGAVGIGSAIGAPLLGLIADRTGQRPVLLATAVLNPAAILLFLLAAYLPAGSTDAWMLAAAFLMGASCPQVGPLARVRWMAITSRRPGRTELDTAMSYESTADEVSFVLGPALVGLLAAMVAPWLPLVLAAVLTASMVSAFAVHPTVREVRSGAERKTAGSSAEERQPRGAWLRIALPVLGMVSMGTFFGSTQTSLTAFAGSFGIASAAGLLYAVMGISSAAAALSVAFWPERFGPALRWSACAALMLASTLLLFLPSDVPSMLLALLILGIPVGPTMVSIFGIGAVVAPGHLMGTVMTLLASGIVTGTALGASIAGQLADSSGHSAAFVVPVCAAAVLLVLGLVARRVAASAAAAAASAAAADAGAPAGAAG